MKVIKNINNNISLCLDSRNNEVVAFGKGIGFTKPPYDVPLSKIDRTFYDVDEEQLAVLNRIPEDVLKRRPRSWIWPMKKWTTSSVRM